jgi:hypothetical protein
MATDLVSEITGVVSQEISSRIAENLGVDKATVQQAVNAIVPTLLAALMSYVSKPGAAAKLNQVVAKQEPGMLSSLASVIGQPGQKALVDQGASVLTSLLGGKQFSALTGAVDKYADIGGQGSKTLMGLLGPVVLGVLGRQQREKGLDASGLANLLTSQKSNVVGALPSGFAKYLGDTGILDDVRISPKVTSTPTAGPSIVPWLLGGLLLLALGALLWHLNKRPLETTSAKPEAPIAGETTAPSEAPYAGLFNKLQGVKAGDIDVGQLANSALNDLYASLVGIKDEATAQSSLPKLTKASSEFDQLTAVLDQLSPENRKALSALFTSIKPNLDQLFDRALAIPGVGTIIKPTVDTIRSKLEALTKV